MPPTTKRLCRVQQVNSWPSTELFIVVGSPLGTKGWRFSEVFARGETTRDRWRWVERRPRNGDGRERIGDTSEEN